MSKDIDERPTCIDSAESMSERLNDLLRVVSKLADLQPSFQASLDALNAKIDAVEEGVDRSRHVLAAVSRRTRVIPSVVRVLFIVHFAENWVTVHSVFKAMLEAKEFNPVVVTVGASFLGEPLGREDELHSLLEKSKIPHLRWKNMDDDFSKYLFHYLDPDIVFRQTAWERSVPESLRTVETSTTRICYIPYALDLTESDHIVNLEMHHAAWRIFVPSRLHAEYFRGRSNIGGTNAVAVGHPGLDAITDQLSSGGLWPITNAGQAYRVIWAPHHSVHQQWLGFATFPAVYMDMLQLARSRPDVQIVFRSHSLLFSNLRSSEVMASSEIEEFLTAWEALPNTHVDREPSYAATFAASDLLVTDGISFLAEYQVVGKPLVFIERDDHAPLNAFGRRAVQGTYVVKDGPSAVAKILAFRDGAEDTLKDIRAEIVREISAYPRSSADLILDEIRSGLAEERALTSRS